MMAIAFIACMFSRSSLLRRISVLRSTSFSYCAAIDCVTINPPNAPSGLQFRDKFYPSHVEVSKSHFAAAHMFVIGPTLPTGNEPQLFLEPFRSPRFMRMSLTRSMALTRHEPVKAHPRIAWGVLDARYARTSSRATSPSSFLAQHAVQP
jgi:hypothetical protein